MTEDAPVDWRDPSAELLLVLAVFTVFSVF